MALLNAAFHRRERMRRRGWLDGARRFWDHWAEMPEVVFTAEDGRRVRCVPFLRPGALPSRGWTVFFPGGMDLDMPGRTLPSTLAIARMLRDMGFSDPGFFTLSTRARVPGAASVVGESSSHTAVDSNATAAV